MNVAPGLMESESSLELLDADVAFPGVVADDFQSGDLSGSGLHTAFVLGGFASLQFAALARKAAAPPKKPR
jgi:hypothetical protein